MKNMLVAVKNLNIRLCTNPKHDAWSE